MVAAALSRGDRGAGPVHWVHARDLWKAPAPECEGEEGRPARGASRRPKGTAGGTSCRERGSAVVAGRDAVARGRARVAGRSVSKVPADQARRQGCSGLSQTRILPVRVPHRSSLRAVLSPGGDAGGRRTASRFGQATGGGNLLVRLAP